MSDTIELTAEIRTTVGKGASRRLRRLEDKVPAIIYGGSADAQMLTLSVNELGKAMQLEAFYSQILNVTIGGKTEQAVVRDLQRNPANERVQHIDFQRVSADREINVNVPLHFVNEEQCAGVKLGGGMIQKQATDIEVQCLPKDLPEYLEVDMLAVELGQIVHLSDITLPDGVISTALEIGEDHDLAIASVIAPRGTKEADEDIEETEGDEVGGDGDADAPAADDAGDGGED